MIIVGCSSDEVVDVMGVVMVANEVEGEEVNGAWRF